MLTTNTGPMLRRTSRSRSSSLESNGRAFCPAVFFCLTLTYAYPLPLTARSYSLGHGHLQSSRQRVNILFRHGLFFALRVVWGALGSLKRPDPACRHNIKRSVIYIGQETTHLIRKTPRWVGSDGTWFFVPESLTVELGPEYLRKTTLEGSQHT